MEKIAYISIDEEESLIPMQHEHQELIYCEKLVLAKDQLDLDGYSGVIIQETKSEELYNVCELIMNLKRKNHSFIWVITKNAQQTSNLLYLKLGADGIIDSRCECEQIKWSIKNTLMRYQKQGDSMGRKKQLQLDDYQLFSRNLSIVLADDTEIELTKLEYKIFELLNTKPNQAYSYAEIYQHVWGTTTEMPKSRVANIIFHIRTKLEIGQKGKRNRLLIKTVRNKGYMLCMETTRFCQEEKDGKN
ncbi:MULTISPECIES: winged helix-turn-helix domain-containing protein [unclassified Enterococcus]|uniref:winged helix-turn-helix domain-containing protein n=1 Tax=unclassified Enterococcus TaxID=2608891 RepID=UPI001CE0409E|nr:MULTISPECIES: winged helix-turn-helix domain-containing protein [unclassified Enterococcus]MCA5011467.1 winged helix-turn-helix domain-containing protein [Enterococcus sp. S23]MCA5015091.1 winged helix-turn-helix domain-containing protein [Enterococcus sp. S22(2020)]